MSTHSTYPAQPQPQPASHLPPQQVPAQSRYAQHVPQAPTHTPPQHYYPQSQTHPEAYPQAYPQPQYHVEKQQAQVRNSAQTQDRNQAVAHAQFQARQQSHMHSQQPQQPQHPQHPESAHEFDDDGQGWVEHRERVDLQVDGQGREQGEGEVRDQEQEQQMMEMIEPLEVTFDVSEHYIVEKLIGEGAYGHVASAIHVHSGTRVAIKRISPFNHAMFSQRTLREIKLLRHFQHENIISILDIISPPPYEDFTEVYLVQELMETDLHRVIHSQVLSDDHCQYFLYQTVRGLKALHSANVLHRDLKPSNLLLNANCDLKICDFGLARSAAAPPPDAGPNGGNGFMTEYVATRWYRAPEVMLSFQEYTKAIDMWSVGCILGEMINGKPLFPGRDYHHQLHLILDVVGTPNMDDFNEITSPGSKDYLRTLPLTRRKDLHLLCPKGKPKAIDFLKRCLTFSPSKRMTVEEALDHVYLEPYHEPNDEPGAEELQPEFFNFTLPQREDGEDDPRIREFMKRLTYAEILKPIYG